MNAPDRLAALQGMGDSRLRKEDARFIQGLRSSAVSTAITPGTFSASDLSIPLIRACANGLRTMSMCSMPGILMSST